MGSVAESVLRAAPCLVLMVKDKAGERAGNN
jgi:nucleotide-binding universal stress UspA family protein